MGPALASAASCPEAVLKWRPPAMYMPWHVGSEPGSCHATFPGFEGSVWSTCTAMSGCRSHRDCTACPRCVRLPGCAGQAAAVGFSEGVGRSGAFGLPASRAPSRLPSPWRLEAPVPAEISAVDGLSPVRVATEEQRRVWNALPHLEHFHGTATFADRQIRSLVISSRGSPGAEPLGPRPLRAGWVHRLESGGAPVPTAPGSLSEPVSDPARGALPAIGEPRAGPGFAARASGLRCATGIGPGWRRPVWSRSRKAPGSRRPRSCGLDGRWAHGHAFREWQRGGRSGRFVARIACSGPQSSMSRARRRHVA